MLDVGADNRARSMAAMLRLRRAPGQSDARDGLNLVAKEGPLVNEHDGVLVL